jgi:hypothetical protein
MVGEARAKQVAGFGSALADTEDEYIASTIGVLQVIPCFTDQVGDVDLREWIGAFDDDNVIRWQTRERLACPQRREGALEPAKIKRGLGHLGSWLASEMRAVDAARALDHHGIAPADSEP